MKYAHKMNRNHGFTIIELMITLVITSVLILGSVNFLVLARKSNQVQSALSELNSSGRFGLEQISRDVRMSGYRDSDWTLGPLDDVLTADHGESADGGDSLTIVYEGTRDCDFAVSTAGIVTNVYQVVDGVLQCNGQSATSGVQEMQVYFGEDTDADDVANRWMPAGTTGLNMERVVSVRVHLLARTDGNNVSTSAQAYHFNNAQQDAVDDGQIRREYSVTVALRNPT
jgi:type IV pilus assembly protein PilW